MLYCDRLLLAVNGQVTSVSPKVQKDGWNIIISFPFSFLFPSFALGMSLHYDRINKRLGLTSIDFIQSVNIPHEEIIIPKPTFIQW